MKPMIEVSPEMQEIAEAIAQRGTFYVRSGRVRVARQVLAILEVCGALAVTVHGASGPFTVVVPA